MSRVTPRWYYWVSGFFVLDTMQALGFIDQLVYGPLSPGGSTVTQILNLLMIASSLTLFAYSCNRGTKGVATGSVLAFSAAAFLLLSSLWSLNPAMSARTAVIYLFVILGAVGVARAMLADEFMHLLAWCCFISAIASLFLVVASPGIAFAPGDYEGTLNFKGVFPFKNILGQVMATGALAALHGIRVARRRYVAKLSMLVVFVGLAYASKSTGALLASLVFCGISGFDSLWRKGGAARQTGVIFAACLAPVLVLALAAPDTLLELIGKDPTLTGRTEIWAYVREDIWRKPLLGWGYFGFWQLTNPAALEISDAVHWVVPQAHNGLLEFLLNIGLIGTALFALILIRTMVLAVRCLGTTERAIAISTIACCVGILQEGVSEIVLLPPTYSLTPVVFITGLMCERALHVAEGRRYRITDSRGPVGRRLSGSRSELRAHA
jgi:exopolysaccharide production protein ExoQ